MKRTLTLCIVVFLVIVSPRSPFVSAQTPQTYGLGEPVPLNGLFITANELLDVTPTKYHKPSTGMRFVAVDFTVENKRDESVEVYAASETWLKDADARIYDRDYSATQAAEEQTGMAALDLELVPGEKARGIVGFQVPTSAEDFTFLYDDSIRRPGKVLISLESPTEKPSLPKPIPTSKPKPSPTTETQSQPDMTFVADVTIPDDTVMQPGEVFTKTWKLKNTGDVDWVGYSLQFVGDGEMNAEPDNVAPVRTNGVTDVSVTFTAPETDGTYTSWWALVNENETRVGSQFYVRIIVATDEVSDLSEPSDVPVYSMNEHFLVGNVEFYGVEVFRNKMVYEWDDTPIIAHGVFALTRIKVTNHTGRTIRLFTDFVFGYQDVAGNTYGYEYMEFFDTYDWWSEWDLRVMWAAQRHFGNQNADIIDTIQPDAPDHPVVLAYEVPDDIDVLYFVIIDRRTGETAKIHLQPLVSKQEQLYEGEFIDAPARE